MPQRIQLRRTKGWRKPEGTVNVARPSRWGNWYVVERNEVVTTRGGITRYSKTGPLWVVAQTRRNRPTGAAWGTWDDEHAATVFAVELFERALIAAWAGLDGAIHKRFYLDGLEGKDLACWCPLDQPCHGDVLLELANG